MTTPALRAYRFRTPAQWSACLFDRVERGGAQDGIRPLAPYEHAARLYPSGGAHAPAATAAGHILWRDDRGMLHRLAAVDEEVGAGSAPWAIARASRLVASGRGLWARGQSPDTLERYDEQTLTRLAVVGMTAARVIDIAGDGREMLFALVEREGIVQALPVDCAEHQAGTVRFEGVAGAAAFAYLGRAHRFVVLGGGARPQLCWFDAASAALVKCSAVGALHPCFEATALGSDGRGRVFVAGSDDAGRGPSFVLAFDGDGELLDEIALDARDAPPTGVAGTRDSVLVTGPRGLLRYALAQAVPEGRAEVRCALVTPMLHSPDRADARRWLRIEAQARLPEGASLEISYAATADPAVAGRLAAIAADTAAAPGLRARRLLQEPGIWSAPIAFHGQKATPGETVAPLSAPLFDEHAPWVWVCVSLGATAGGALPALDELAVLYPGQSLMDDLPAIYRRAESQPRSFLRSLVGVLETTTQGLDARIGALAGQVHPAGAGGPWLDFVASWLGLPWDEALAEAQKKCLLAHASTLAHTRGTRAGLETLLACLVPGTPPRFRVLDATADAGFAIVGGEGCRGSALPAMLGGGTPWNRELGFGTVLGRMRLPCPGQAEPDGLALAGGIRVEVAASAAERRAWEPWLAAVVEQMVPLTARVQLHWVNARMLHAPRLDGSLVLEGPPAMQLGDDAVLGLARLPEGASSITGSGADTGTRLQ